MNVQYISIISYVNLHWSSSGVLRVELLPTLNSFLTHIFYVGTNSSFTSYGAGILPTLVPLGCLNIFIYRPYVALPVHYTIDGRR